MNDHEHIRLLRWFLLAWVSLVYLWAILSLFNDTKWQLASFAKQCKALPPMSSSCPQPGTFPLLPAMLACTLLMLLYALLLWVNLSGIGRQCLLWLSFVMQGGLAFAVGLIVPQGNIVLSLLLTLTLSAISLHLPIRSIIVVASGSLALFFLSESLGKQGGAIDWAALLANPPFGDMAPIPFVIGYLLLYIQQVRSHVRLAEAHAELAIAHRQLQSAHVELATSAERIKILILMTERQRLARELHDTLAQGMAGMVMQIQAANSQLTQHHDRRAQEILQHMMGTARELFAAARSAIDDLRSMPMNPHSFTQSMQEEIQRFTAMTGISCVTDDFDVDWTLPPFFYEQIQRAISEALTNVACHAQARRVWVRVSACEQMLTIEVQDDGVGFDPAVVKQHAGHYGLQGMQERACLVGGSLTVISSPGQGTLVRLRLPKALPEV